MTIVYGENLIGNTEHKGYIKIKLVHTENFSLLIPDQIYLQSPQVWLQPKTWLPSILHNDGKSIKAVIFCDVSEGVTLEITFEDSLLLNSYSDGSFLYECVIAGPSDLASLAASKWFFHDNRPFLQVYHHTGLSAKDNITKTREFWQSSWNIQGTKKLLNIGYVYFTPIVEINTEKDLQRIGMSPQKVLHFLRDNVQIPRIISSNWRETKLAEDILELSVYWSAPEERRETICVYVDASTLAPQHAWWHKVKPSWYEVAFSDILRVGIKPGKTLPISSEWMTAPDKDTIKQFNYIILGDAGTLEGLAAPTSEDTTTHKFKIHNLSESPLKFWFNNSNQNHYTKISTEIHRFQDTE